MATRRFRISTPLRKHRLYPSQDFAMRKTARIPFSVLAHNIGTDYVRFATASHLPVPSPAEVCNDDNATVSIRFLRHEGGCP